MYRMDPGDISPACVGGSGMEVRDPTSDLRLVKFCLAIPEDQYLKNGQPRRLLHRMMQNILPSEFFTTKTKGLQAADWYEDAFKAKDDMKEWLTGLEASSESPRYLDLKQMRNSVENWPETGWDEPSVIQEYRLKLMRGLAVGAFIQYVEGGNK